VGFWKLEKHVTEVPNHRYYLRETENQDTCSVMVFPKEIGNKGYFSCFMRFSSQIAGDRLTIVS
jgi:hypothetical protein